MFKSTFLFGKRLIMLHLLLFFTSIILAQTPYANRIKAKIAVLPSNAKVVAKYTDTQRHSVYYAFNNRLFKYDVKNNKEQEVNFCLGGYQLINNIWLDKDATHLIIEVQKEELVGQKRGYKIEHWKVNSFTNDFSKYTNIKDPLDSSEALKTLGKTTIKKHKHTKNVKRKYY